MEKENLIFLLDAYHCAPLWLNWGFIDQIHISKIAEIGYFIIYYKYL